MRFGLLAAAIGLLIFLVFFLQTLLGSLLNGFIGALQNQSATVLVDGADARRSLEASVVSPETVQLVAAVEGVGEAVSLGQATLTFVAAGDQVDVAVFGAEPGQPGQPTRLSSGRLATAPGEAVASSEDQTKGFAVGGIASGATRTVTRSEAVNSLPGIKQQRSTFNAIIATTFLVATLVVALFFALLTIERIAMYAVFKAVVASSSQIFVQVISQAVVIALTAFVVGALLAVGATFAIPPQVPLLLTSARTLQVLVGLVIMSVLGSGLSLRRVVRVDPASAIGGGREPHVSIEARTGPQGGPVR